MEAPPVAPGRSRAMGVDSVKVIVRVRPLNGKERHEQTKSCVRIASSPDGLSCTRSSEVSSAGPQQLIVGKDRAFTFDDIYGIDSSQHYVYRHTVEPLVDCFLEGYNATVLAYGQTGTGKTHTMSGSSMDPKGGKSDELQGIIPRVVRAIFDKMQSNQQHKEYNLRVEYIEIYNEELRDLLHPETPTKQLSIREDGEGNIVMAGVKSETVPSKEAVFRLLALGGGSRVTGSTMMNEQSSRSHAIFSLIIQQRDLATNECRKAKFHLVDLAGSERAKRTGAVAGRFKESISINQGLLALGNVISALSGEKRKLGASDRATAAADRSGIPPPTAGSSTSVHVPYRDSKLTRLLQDSLGGNAKTLMIACVSPAAVNFEETLNTLKYANRAKNIKNRPIVNQQTQEEKQKADDEIARMKEEIALLQSQLQHGSAPSTAGSTTSGRPETASSLSSSACLSTPSGRSRRHSIAVNTSTVSISQDAISAEQQQHQRLRKKCRAYADTMETMRGLNVEAITSLIAMERDIKPLGRPVQQRLNEIVKMLNAAVQAVGSVESSLRKSLRTSLAGETASTTPVDADSETVKRLSKELTDAKADLARDEQIFEMKNTEIQRLQAFVTEAKVKNEKLLQRVQELERSGQLWSVGLPRSSVEQNGKTGPDDETADNTRRSGELHASGAIDPAAKRSTSSRGLFTKRTGTAASGFEPQEDNVLIGTDEDESSSLTKSRDKSGPSSGDTTSTTACSTVRRSIPTSQRGCITTGNDDHSVAAMTKMEKLLATLRGKVDELQQQNGELLHGREESMRRWQLERQQYERQINDAELAIEALRKTNQSLEDTLMEDRGNQNPTKHTKQDDAVSSSHQVSRAKGVQQSMAELVIDDHEEIENPTSSRSKPIHTTSTHGGASTEQVMELWESSVRRLMEFNQARQQVLHLVKEKKAAQQNVEEASRRLNALEMQKLRQSMSLRESIADVSASLCHINEKMQHEHRTVEEIERLTKLKQRAERKLKTLRRQEEHEEFLDPETQQEVADLEELVEDLKSHIAFQDSELVAAREEMELLKQHKEQEEQQQKSPLESMAQAMVEHLGIEIPDAAGTKTTLSFVAKCLEDLARLRAREQELLADIRDRGSQVEQRDAALNQLESGLVAARKEFDRRLQLQIQESDAMIKELEATITQLKTEKKTGNAKFQPQSLEPEHTSSSSSHQDEEWQKLIVSCQKKDEYITDLEKHVVFYKSKAKQMQMQLTQLIKDSAGNQEDDHGGHGGRHSGGGEGGHDDEGMQLQKRIQQLEHANDALMKDLATAKVYLRMSKSRSSAEGAQMVRISKSELREVPRPSTAVSSRDEDDD